MNRDLPKRLIIVAIIVGSIFFFGTTTYKIFNNYIHRNYIETTGTFIQINEACPSNDGKEMYRLMYEYIVNGQEYHYITDYCTSAIPKIGSIIKIKYNPSDPSQAYSNSFDVFSVFQIIGAFFLFVSLIILFFEWVWFRDILIFLGTSVLIVTFIINNFYTGGFIIALIILGIMCFASVMDFISYLKSNRFEPLADIKREMNRSKQIKLIKKQAKHNLTTEEKKIKEKKNKRIKIAILLLLTFPLDIFIAGWHPSETMYMIGSVVSALCFFAGFCIIGMTLVGAFDNQNTVTLIAGKVIDNEDIKNRKNMTLSEKMKAFNIYRLILRIIAVPLFLGMCFLIFEDPLNFFNIFKNVARAQLFALIGLVITGNALYVIFNKIKVSKSNIIMFIISIIVMLLYVIFITTS